MAQETFSDRLRQTMSDRDVRQSDVIRASEMLGKKLGKSQMSQYVSGKTIPRRDVAELLARILEVDVTWLLAGDADQGETPPSRKVAKSEPSPSAQIPRSTTMRTFSKSTKLDNVLYDVRGPVVDEAARMEDEGERILKLNIGNPAPFGFRTPDYPLWTACATLAGGHPVHYLCDEQADWYPDLEDMESKITSATKALVIINPNNPTGSVYPREVLEGIVEIARRHQLMIFADEIYDRLCMDGYEHVSIASLAPDLPCVTFSGLSKSHMIAGYRIGWMVLSGNQRCMSDFIMGVNMLSNMRLCSNVPAQSIVQTALGGHQSVNDYIRPGGRVYEQRNFVYEALNKIDGISVVKPRAAFYIFPKMDVKKFNITDDEQFALDLLHEKKILITRGGGFNWAEPDHFRIVYLPRMEVLKESLEDLADFFDHYRQS